MFTCSCNNFRGHLSFGDSILDTTCDLYEECHYETNEVYIFLKCHPPNIYERQSANRAHVVDMATTPIWSLWKCCKIV